MNTAIATVAKDVGTDVTGIQTAITLYTLVMASLMITGGRVGEIIGRKRAFTIGCIVYACGSLTTALSHSLPVLIIGWSFLEGFGAVLIMPAIVALVASNFGTVGPAACVRAGGGCRRDRGCGGAGDRRLLHDLCLVAVGVRRRSADRDRDSRSGAAGERHAGREGRQARPGRHRAVGGRARADRDRHPALRCVGVRAAQAGCSRVAGALAGDLARARGRCGGGPVRSVGEPAYRRRPRCADRPEDAAEHPAARRRHLVLLPVPGAGRDLLRRSAVPVGCARSVGGLHGHASAAALADLAALRRRSPQAAAEREPATGDPPRLHGYVRRAQCSWSLCSTTAPERRSSPGRYCSPVPGSGRSRPN